MQHSKMTIVEAEVITDITCDLCKKSCNRGTDKDTDCPDQPLAFEYATLDVNWGYSTKRDGERRSFHICEACYEIFLKTFNVADDVGIGLPWET